jgi:hypothetical protein
MANRTSARPRDRPCSRLHGANNPCRIVEQRPTEKTIVVLGDRAYVTREEAERQVKVGCRD